MFTKLHKELMEKKLKEDDYIKKMLYYMKLNPKDGAAKSFKNKFFLQDNWIENIEVQDLSNFKPIKKPKRQFIKVRTS